MRKDVVNVVNACPTDRAWLRRLLAALAPAPPDTADWLTRHYATEIRLAHDLVQNAEFLGRYPHARVRVLDAAESAHRRAQHIRRTLEGLEHSVTEPDTRSGQGEPSARESLRASVAELSDMSETYLADAQALERERPDIAGLLYGLHRDTARELRDLMWTVAQVPSDAVKTSLDEVAG